MDDYDGPIYHGVEVDDNFEGAIYHVKIVGGGSGDQHNLGWYATESALTTAHPTAEAGDYAIVGSTDTVWIWDTDNSEWVDSDQKGQVTSVNGQTGAVTVSAVPDQTGQSGKFLTTDGTDASWATVNALQNTATGTSSMVISNITNATSLSQGYNTVIGISSTPNISVGWGTTAIGSGGMGYGKSNNTIIGYNAYIAAANDYNIVIGDRSSITTGQNIRAQQNIAIGSYARVGAFATPGVSYAIQLGGGQNLDSNTFKVYNSNGNFEMMSADGTIPTARLTKVNTTITLTAAGWSNGSQTVTVSGITSTGVVFVSPDPTDQADYTTAGIICTAQATDSLTFTATTTPSNDIDVVVVML